jgi:hypothetical protein
MGQKINICFETSLTTTFTNIYGLKLVVVKHISKVIKSWTQIATGFSKCGCKKYGLYVESTLSWLWETILETMVMHEASKAYHF